MLILKSCFGQKQNAEEEHITLKHKKFASDCFLTNFFAKFNPL